MSAKVKAVNSFFKNAVKSDVERLKEDIILSDRQDTIFQMFYIKRKDIGFIADSLCVSQAVINRELKRIRDKIVRVFGE